MTPTELTDLLMKEGIVTVQIGSANDPVLVPCIVTLASHSRHTVVVHLVTAGPPKRAQSKKKGS